VETGFFTGILPRDKAALKKIEKKTNS